MKILGAVNLPLPFGSAGSIHWMNTMWHIAEAGATTCLLGGVSPSSDIDEILAFYGLNPDPRFSIRLTRPWPISPLNRSSTLRARAYLWELVRLIRLTRPHVLYGMGMPNHLWALGHFKKFVPFRIVLELHEDHCTPEGRLRCVQLMKGPNPVLSGIITVSPAHRELLIEDGASPRKVHTFPAAHRPDLIPNDDRHALIEKLRLPVAPDNLIVLYGGNLYGDRGIDDLLEAFRHVIHKIPKTHLIVLGAGEPDPERRIRAITENHGFQSKVHFTGRVSPTTVGNYLALADLGVVPNPDRGQWKYGSPMKLSEYLGAGLPVVATNLLTTAELVLPEKAALLVPPGSPTELADAIIKLLGDEPMRRSMRERGFRVGQKLTYQARAESIYQFLQQSLDCHES